MGKSRQIASVVLDYTPRYTDIPITGVDNSIGQNVIIFMKKSDFENVDINTLAEIYKQNDAIAFVFEDNSALVFEEKSRTLHFAEYDNVTMFIKVKTDKAILDE